MIKDIIRMSFKTIISNKLRSWLSMLGIIIWVLTIMLVVAIWQWAQKTIEDQYKNLNVTTIMVMPENIEWWKSKVSEDDVEFLLTNWQYIAQATPLIQWKLPVSTNDASDQFNIVWIKADFSSISNLHLTNWRIFSEEEDKARTKVVVLWYGVLQDLFGGDTGIIGDFVTIGGRQYEIIGIFEPSWATVWPISYDDSIFLPYETTNKITLWVNGTIRLITLATDIDMIGPAMSELVDLLRQSHNLKSSSPDDFKLKDQWAKVVSAQESAQTMSILLITVAIIVLIVSWIWIMNVMFAWVAERTKEIWILKSIWAKRNDILYQFLVESIILTLIAWLLWVFVGEIIIPLGNGIDWMMLIRSNYGDLLAFMFALLVWIFFWWYPAYIASKLDPVDALRL